MKKYLLLIPVIGSVLVLTFWQTTSKKPQPYQPLTQTSQIPIETPTPPLDTATTPPADPVPPPTPSPSPSDSGTTLIDAKSSDYATGKYVSNEIYPLTFWTWNVSYTCSTPITKTTLPSGAIQTNGPALVVDLMIEVPSDPKPEDATMYHTVQINDDGTGSYSVTENATSHFYFRVSGNCDWHLQVLDNGAPLYPVIAPCTAGQQVTARNETTPASCGH